MTDWFDSQAVGWAASFGQLGALRCLVDLGADPMVINKASNTALSDAKRERHSACIEYMENYVRMLAGGEKIIRAVPPTTALSPTNVNSFPNKLTTQEIAGCWACVCMPVGLAIFIKEAVNEDELKHSGCLLLPIPLPFCGERRLRVPNSNNFYKSDEPGNIDVHSSRRCACNGPSCSMKFC
jgi:hypothetical protein